MFLCFLVATLSHLAFVASKSLATKRRYQRRVVAPATNTAHRQCHAHIADSWPAVRSLRSCIFVFLRKPGPTWTAETVTAVREVQTPGLAPRAFTLLVGYKFIVNGDCMLFCSEAIDLSKSEVL